jgi:hypothetical protein
MIEVAMVKCVVWYAGAESLNVCSSDESSAMRLLIDVSSCLIMLGGWLEYTYLFIADRHWASYIGPIFSVVKIESYI